MKVIVLLQILIVSLISAQTVTERNAQWQETLQEIHRSCLYESYEDVDCVHVENGNSLKKIPYVLDRAVIGISGAAIPSISRFIKNTFWGSSLLVAPNQEQYWLDHQITQDYIRLKKSLKNKSEKEGLRSCQKACLSTCVSSKIIKYSREFKNQLSSTHGKIESGKADCKGFSAIADDVNYALGISSRVVLGTVYERGNTEMKALGGHAQVMVKILGKHYIMEPQSSSCRFYPTTFSKKVKPLKFHKI